MSTLESLARVVLIGAGATVLMDAWLLLMSRLGVPTTDWRLVGRWVGQMPQGRFVHAAMAAVPPVRGEHALGWATHYLVGIGYALALVALAGPGWLHAPTLATALAFGLATVAVPLFVMQPAMGSGFAASKTPRPLWSCLRSFANHGVFGAGLYVAAAGLACA